MKYINDTNTSIYGLAFGIERLDSAVSWSNFFNTPGRSFNINNDAIKDSCLNKISEVEERLEYIKLYIPLPLEEIRKEVDYAYDDYNKKEYSLCLYKASKAKAQINVILNSMGVKDEQITQLIDDRIYHAEQIIGKQIQNDVFPIVGYSYYEYAKSLKENDNFSSLLYLEYAIELSKLDTYFKQDRFEFPVIDESYVIFFIIGFMWGFLICFLWLKREFIGSRKKKD